METDAKPFDGGATVIAALGGSAAVDILEKELRQMRNALSEKTQEAQILMQRLEQANRIIEQLRQQRRTMLGQDATACGTTCKTTESE